MRSLKEARFCSQESYLTNVPSAVSSFSALMHFLALTLSTFTSDIITLYRNFPICLQSHKQTNIQKINWQWKNGSNNDFLYLWKAKIWTGIKTNNMLTAFVTTYGHCSPLQSCKNKYTKIYNATFNQKTHSTYTLLLLLLLLFNGLFPGQPG